MKCAAAFLVFALAFVTKIAVADTVDHLAVIGNGQDFEFSLPSTTTAPASEISREYGFGAVDGTLNGTPESLFATLVFPTVAGVGADTFTVGYAGNYVVLALPSMYTLSFAPTGPVGGGTGTLTFLPGTYSSFIVSPRPEPYLTYSITVAPAAAAVTPEPPSFWLLITALAGMPLLLRKQKQLSWLAKSQA